MQPSPASRRDLPRSRATRLCGLAVLLLGAGSLAHAEPTPLELAVKATYLYKLAPFVSWPAEAFASPNAPLSICIQGADPFGPILDRAVAGQAVGGHPLQVRRMARIDAASGCQIAYLGGGAGQSTAQALASLESAPVLTVTDEARGPARGVVHLVLSGEKVRFAIDTVQAPADSLTINAKLLALALTVRR